MSKPIIFFSHSSSDKEVLIKLKNLFLEKTGDTIDVFLSSDGESIPFGRNWVQKIQDSLNDSKIMIVFMSPNSIRSNWVYFESGFSYSKGIKVIPVGFLGFDLNLLAPPLSLLQGFNISSEEGLNNLIGIINKEFEYNLELNFTKDNYNEITQNSNALSNSIFRNYNYLIENIEFFLNENDFECKRDEIFDKIKEMVANEKEEYQVNDSKINLHGVSIIKSDGVYPEYIHVKIDPVLIEVNIDFIQKLLPLVRKNGIEGLNISINFYNRVELIYDIEKLTSRIYKTEIKLDEKKGFKFKELWFNIMKTGSISSGTSYVYLDMILKNDEISLTRFNELLDLLFKQGIVYVNQW